MRPVRIGIVAGEASGDLLGAAVISALRRYFSPRKIEFAGVAGDKMLNAGAKTLFPLEKLSVMGFSEVLFRLPELLSLRRKVKNFFLSFVPDIYIGIDAPDFNLPIEKALKKSSIKIVHINSPTIWAWRKNRIDKIKKSIDLMLTLFPFEAQYYEKADIAVKYIGHPLADSIALKLKNASFIKNVPILRDNQKKIIALLPGSRSGEIKYIGPVLLKAAQLFHQKYPDSLFLAPMINHARYCQFERQFKTLTPNLPLILSRGNAQTVIRDSHVAALASGTATLEAMLLKKPMTVVYKCSAFSYAIAKRLIKIPQVSLPNILAGKALVPEFIQNNAVPENVFKSLEQYFLYPDKVNRLQEKFLTLHQKLRCNAAEKAAKAIGEIILKNSLLKQPENS